MEPISENTLVGWCGANGVIRLYVYDDVSEPTKNEILIATNWLNIERRLRHQMTLEITFNG